jgi:cytoskeletal protein RodZ
MSDAELVSALRTESAPAPIELITSAGSLRSLRIAKGLSIDEVATRLKFSSKYIEALESEQFDSLPRGLALKGIVKNYARLLGIDSSAIELALQPYIGKVTGGIADHTSTRSLGAHQTHHTFNGSPIWLLVIFLVVVGAVSIAVWQGIVPQSWIPVWLGGVGK